MTALVDYKMSGAPYHNITSYGLSSIWHQIFTTDGNNVGGRGETLALPLFWLAWLCSSPSAWQCLSWSCQSQLWPRKVCLSHLCGHSVCRWSLRCHPPCEIYQHPSNYQLFREKNTSQCHKRWNSVFWHKKILSWCHINRAIIIIKEIV